MFKGLVSLVFIAVIVVAVVVGIFHKIVDKETPVSLKEDMVVMSDQAGLGIQDPRDVGLQYSLRMDVEGYLMCKDVNKAIFKLVPRDDVVDKSPEKLIELIREGK